MNNHQPILLLTRPIEQSERDAHYFKEKGIKCAFAPMLEYNDLNLDPPDWANYSALIVTSAQAIKAVKSHNAPSEIPVFCVGDQSAQAAIDHGFMNVHSASGTAQELIGLIKKYKDNLPPKPFLYLRGADISVDVVHVLQGESITCESIICYKAQTTGQFPQDALHLIQQDQISGVAFYSRRSAKNFERLVRVHNLAKHLKNIQALCLSDNVLECVQALDWAQTHVCPQPDGQKFKDFIVGLLQ